MPLVTGVQVIGETRLEVWFNTKPLALVGQERIMFGGLSTTFKEGAVTVSVPIARTPAASACEPLADGAMVTTKPLATLALLTLWNPGCPPDRPWPRRQRRWCPPS